MKELNPKLTSELRGKGERISISKNIHADFDLLYENVIKVIAPSNKRCLNLATFIDDISNEELDKDKT